ncbi:hypothetical protein BH747_01020 [Enterococcus villorum]|uniref:Uncharacterized protein n=1 Tax=Enterococcus villorum TaxID=112904 RepID=A0A1V8YFQ2_9ENTE|nr:hypothetical protein [Enterococcus villorum]OQO71445.1 hypothetical protein BH747_01020 [Enterococcus villorum]OQO76620.1 hypothetical protein BH744_02085 [Enterococcus villorum]
MNEFDEQEKREELNTLSEENETIQEEIKEASSKSHLSDEESLIEETEPFMTEENDDIQLDQKHGLNENQVYLETKDKDHQDIVLLIETAEAELADLRLRKYLIESDFSELLDSFEHYITKGEPISPIGKTSLIEYLTYELLKPLNDIGLTMSSSTYDTWETRHFSINYFLNEQNKLIFSFVLPTINQRYQVESIHLLEVSPETMEITVQDDRVLSLIRYWSVERVFSAGQITIFNHKLNQILAHARKLGFFINQTLLDNTKPLHLNLQSEHELTNQVLDDIFIVTMKNSQYDFEKSGQDHYKVLLDKGQSLAITRNEHNQTILEISSGEYHRSVIDFFINYEFLVPLMVRKT